jgi:hypothetical protein
MNLRCFTGSRPVAAAALLLCALLIDGCSKGKDPSLIGTFHMGERVQAGPLTYNVLEAEWRPALAENGRMPKNRFLFLRVSISNTSAQPVAAPGLTLVGPNETAYQETTDNMEAVGGWLGMFRNIQPGKTETGYVVFDAPVGGYKVSVSDGGEIENERHAFIQIPADLDASRH